MGMGVIPTNWGGYHHFWVVFSPKRTVKTKGLRRVYPQLLLVLFFVGGVWCVP